MANIAKLYLSALFWFVDPLKLFHKPFICENTIYDSARYSARGLIDTMDYDSVILGTSMLENTSAKEASGKLGGKFINISMSGSSFYERKIVFDYLSNHKKLKTILYPLDKEYLIRDHDFVTIYNKTENYKFLYDNYISNDLKAYLNIKYLSYIFKTFFTFGKKCKILNFDRPYRWDKNNERLKLLGGIQMWAKHSNKLKSPIEAIEYIIKGEIEKVKDINYLEKIHNLSFKENLDNNILYFAKKYPQTKFILFIPPYSRVQSALYFRDKALFNTHKNAIKYLLDQNLSNIKIYAFDDMDFTADIANYIDTIHYEEKINSKMLDWISNDIGLLTKDNFESWWQNYEKLAKEFDLEGFNNELQRLIKENK